MPKIENGSRSIRQVIERSRSEDTQADWLDISFTGRKGEEFHELFTPIAETVDTIKNVYHDFLQKKREDYEGWFDDNDFEVAEGKFREGLINYALRRYRLHRDQGGGLGEFNQPHYAEQLVTGYGVNFIKALNNGRRVGLNPASAVEVAKFSYATDPNVILELAKKYPQFEPWVWVNAATKNVKDPLGAMEDVVKRKAELTAMFPDVEGWIIDKAAVNRANSSKEYVQDVVTSTKGLIEQFPQLPEAAVRNIVARTKADRREGELERFELRLKDLAQEFPDVPEAYRQDAALYHPESAARFLRGVKEKVRTLSENEKLFTQAELYYMCLKHPEVTETFIENARSALTDLQATYADHQAVDLSILKIAALHHPTSPGEFLEQQLKKLPGLANRYTKYSQTYLLRCLMHNPDNPDIYLNEENAVKLAA